MQQQQNISEARRHPLINLTPDTQQQQQKTLVKPEDTYYHSIETMICPQHPIVKKRHFMDTMIPSMTPSVILMGIVRIVCQSRVAIRCFVKVRITKINMTQHMVSHNSLFQHTQIKWSRSTSSGRHHRACPDCQSSSHGNPTSVRTF